MYEDNKEKTSIKKGVRAKRKGTKKWIIIDAILIIAIIIVIFIIFQQKLLSTASQGEHNPSKNELISDTPAETLTPAITVTDIPLVTALPTVTKAPSETSSPTAEPSPTATPSPEITVAPTPVSDVYDDEYASFNTDVQNWSFRRMADHVPSESFGFDTKYKFDTLDTFYIDKNVTEDDKVIYLTFDCGYENGYSEHILDVLKAHNAKAAFFVTSAYIDQAPEILKRMKEEGHIVGNHTINHLNLATLSAEEVEHELLGNAELFKEATGYDMDCYVRPPEGAYSEKSLHITKDLGYKTIFWSIAYQDWVVDNQPGTDYVLEQFQKYYHNGAIALIHIVSESNSEALDSVLTYLEEQGYRFGTLDEL